MGAEEPKLSFSLKNFEQPGLTSEAYKPSYLQPSSLVLEICPSNMRLINTLDLSLHDFIDDHGIEYAIMSHRWYSAELTYQEMRSREFDKTKQASFDKIRRFCGIAKENGCVWAWADTCCIDKTSSAELQEAINSMF